MNTLPPFNNACLFTGLIFQADLSLSGITQSIEKSFKQNIARQSDVFSFDHSSYYEAEMGPELKRVFLSFQTPVSPDMAFTYKHMAIKLEDYYSDNRSRKINIDPGILNLHNIILFSTKNFAHRIPCQEGIYAELTLLYQNKHFRSYDWTYPDFKRSDVQAFFKSVRQDFHVTLSK